MQLPLDDLRSGTDRADSRQGHVRGMGRRSHCGRSARILRPQAVQRAARVRPRRDRAQRRRGYRLRTHSRAQSRVWSYRFALYYGEYGLGRRREAHPRDRTRSGAGSAPHHRVRVRGRRAHARRDSLPHADGQDVGGARALPRGRRAIYLRPHESDDGGRRREFRVAGRRRLRRAESAHWLCRPPHY